MVASAMHLAMKRTLVAVALLVVVVRVVIAVAASVGTARGHCGGGGWIGA